MTIHVSQDMSHHKFVIEMPAPGTRARAAAIEGPGAGSSKTECPPIIPPQKYFCYSPSMYYEIAATEPSGVCWGIALAAWALWVFVER